MPPADLRVLSCEYPNDYRGQPIRNADALKRSLKTESRTKKRERSFSTMTTTATATPPPATNGEARPTATDPASRTPAAPLDVAKRSTSTAISVYDKISDPLDFIAKMGNTFYDSKMFGCANPAQGRALAFGFLVKRIDPFDFRRRHHIIGGNVTMTTEAMLADFRTEYGGSHRLISRTPEKAAVELVLGRQKQLFEFTWPEAQVEDYVYTKEANEGKTPKKLADGTANPAALKDNWSTPRRRMQMLWARVVSDGVGAMAPEVSGGQQTPEELGVFAADAQAEGVIVDAEFTVVGDAQPATAATAESAPPVEQPPPVFDNSGPPRGAPFLELLRELKPLRDELLTPEQYTKVLDKYGVKTARDLEFSQLESIIVGLRRRKRTKDESSELSNWADGALTPKSEQAAGQAAGVQPGKN